jgi:hypothetical protein
MVQSFAIEPYLGAIPIRFGMKPTEVESEIGPPISILPDHFSNRVEERPHLIIGDSAHDDTLCEAVFAPGAKLLFGQHELFQHPDPIALLRQVDPSPYEWVGFVIFLKLGIRLSGFHDGDESQKAIAVVKKGYWDEHVDDFLPYSASPR